MCCSVGYIDRYLMLFAQSIGKGHIYQGETKCIATTGKILIHLDLILIQPLKTGEKCVTTTSQILIHYLIHIQPFGDAEKCTATTSKVLIHSIGHIPLLGSE